MSSPGGMEERIKGVMAEVLEVEPAAIGPAFDREAAPTWDSLNHLRLVTALEEAFGIRFSMREVTELTSFGRIRRAVGERLSP